MDSPSGDFYNGITCSFLALTSLSRDPWRASSCRCWFFLRLSISSSRSATLRSNSCLSWVSSSWTLRTFPSSASKAPSASYRTTRIGVSGSLQKPAPFLPFFYLNSGLQFFLLHLKTFLQFAKFNNALASLAKLVTQIGNLTWVMKIEWLERKNQLIYEFQAESVGTLTCKGFVLSFEGLNELVEFVVCAFESVHLKEEIWNNQWKEQVTYKVVVKINTSVE